MADLETEQFVRQKAMDLRTDTPLRMAYLSGRSKRMVVCLAGVGTDPHNAPPFELVGAAGKSGENHVLLVSDPLRCWMNHKDYLPALRDAVEAIVAEKNIETVVALGNSMGGSMAILLAEVTKVDTVIALTPQYSVKPDIVPQEKRWMRYRKRINHWMYPHVGDMAVEGTRYFLFHGDDPSEAMHWQLFPKRREITHYILSNTGHRLAAALKARGALSPVLHASMDHRPRVVRRTLERLGGSKMFPRYR